jgi:hypothetical protein
MPETPPKSVYEQALKKCQWAEQHIQKLGSVILELREINPILTSHKTNPETGEVTYYVENVPAIPSSIPLITGDVLHSLRGALDYLACGLVEVVTPDTKFPIAHSAEAYKASLSRLVPRLRKEALEVLDSIRPYQGGNIFLWELHRLNIIDKHRLLLAMSIVNPMDCFAPDEMTAKRGTLPKGISKGSIEIVEQSPIPLHAGKEFLTLSASEAKKYVGSYFAVSINEPSLAEGMPLSMALGFMSKEVWLTIERLAPFLIR